MSRLSGIWDFLSAKSNSQNDLLSLGPENTERRRSEAAGNFLLRSLAEEFYKTYNLE